MKKVIIHFGIHKTASSSIQSSLQKNRPLLEKQGYHYPIFFSHYNAEMSNHSQALFSLFCGRPEHYHLNIKNGYDKNTLSDDINSYEKQLRRALLKPQNVILSAEDLNAFSLNEWNRLITFVRKHCPDACIQLVGFCRRHEGYVASALQERIKGGVVTLDEEKKNLLGFVKNSNRNSFGRIMLLEGVDALSVFSFEEACLHTSGPVGFFIDQIDLSINKNSNFSFVRSNESLPAEGVLFLDKVNRKYPAILDKKKNHERPSILLDGLEGVAFTLDEPYLEKIYLASQSDKNWLFDNFAIDYRLSEKKSDSFSSMNMWDESTLSGLMSRVKGDPLLIELLTELLEEQRLVVGTKNAKAKSRIDRALHKLKFPNKNRYTPLLRALTEIRTKKVIPFGLVSKNSVKRESSQSLPHLNVKKIFSIEGYKQHQVEHKSVISARAAFEKQLLPAEQKPFLFNGYCSICAEVVDFQIDFTHAYPIAGTLTPNWREWLRCPGCQLNNRMRATIHILTQEGVPRSNSKIYLTEQVTPIFQWFKRNYKNTYGSECLGNSVQLGCCNEHGIRNEDVTKLSFADNQFDYILSLDVFEHVPEYMKALKECFRAIKPGGSLFFSVPFNRQAQENKVRAEVSDNGEVIHLLPPEYHGNPLSTKGILCYHAFGWELLEELRGVGFDGVKALFYWSADCGYLGRDQLIFSAVKPG